MERKRSLKAEKKLRNEDGVGRAIRSGVKASKAFEKYRAF